MGEIKMTRLHALSLLDFAQEQGLSEIYREVIHLLMAEDVEAGLAQEPLRGFLGQIPTGELENVLRAFLELARRRMEKIPVEIISAVPLTQEQLYSLELKLIRLTRKQLDITATVDPTVLGGVRILVENTVIDESLKRRLADMKMAIYKGVYFR